MIWQDVLLIFILSVIVTRWMYTTGYKDGYRKAEFDKRQEEIRKSGNYFISQNGTLIPVPPTPPMQPVRGK